MKSFCFSDRNHYIHQLENQYFDLVIVGGGINGAGAARDAALRGMKVALIEKSDFASGTSSRSSKLIHGGIRYLENLEFGLVFEALCERQKLFEIAPHLVHPLRFMIPLYQGGRVGMLKMGAGMWLYDLLSLFQAPELHGRLSPDQALLEVPSLKSHLLLGAYTYSDAYMDDDRLTIETLRSANHEGAVCVSYAEAEHVNWGPDQKVNSLHATDHISGKKIIIRGKHFVSTVGPWTDQLGKKWFPDWTKTLRPTKGVHLTFLKEKLPLQAAVVMAAEERIIFAIPRNDMVIVGTTDTDYSENPDAVVANKDDVKYLLDVLNNYFPGAALQLSDIVCSYAGVRPLVSDHSSSEGKTSREHHIFTESHGVTFVEGGKYTTYRHVAEEVVDHCLHHFSIEDRVRFGKSKSNQPLNPLITADSWRTRHQQMSQRGPSPLSPKELLLLVDRHGPEAFELLENHPHHTGYWDLEVAFAIQNTMCLNLVDFFTRRTHLMLSDPRHGISIINEISRAFQAQLGWSQEKTEQEIQRLHIHIQSELAWRAP